MTDDQSTRDRIRALVRDVLDKIPEEQQPIPSSEQASKFIDTLPAMPAPSSVTRDESAKLVITEDDVRGLDEGAVLRIDEGARLTPLAADIVKEKRIALVRPVPR